MKALKPKVKIERPVPVAQEYRRDACTPKSASHDACVATHNEIADLRPYF